MKYFQFKGAIENKYSHLLAALLLFFVLAPVFDHFNRYFPGTHFIFFIVIMTLLRVLRVRKRNMIWIFCLGMLALTLEHFSRKIYASNYLTAFISLVYVLFLGSTIILLTKNIFKAKKVTGDTVKGGISIYLLLGVWWVSVYSLILMLDSGAIYSVNNDPLLLSDLYQLSFTTLTTVGYGNIIPKSEIAIMFSNLEAVVGQLFLTVFIARLVGFQITDHLAKQKKQDV